jgi:hypothetical protein
MKYRFRFPLLALGLIAVGAMLAPRVEAGWIAYNDSAYQAGQTNSDNTTTYGLGRNFTGQGNTGPLKNFATGADTTAMIAYEEHMSTGSVNSAGDAATYSPDTDAESIFNAKADIAGNISYGDSPGWYVDLTVSGLNPGKKYTFVGTANRSGGAGYADRVTNWKLMGADSATYASSPGAHKVGDDSVEFSTGDNPNGLVARWTDIRAGADGTITIRTSHTVGEANGGIPGANAYKGYAGGVFLVAEQEENWEAFNDSAFKAGQIESENATTVGIGRSFEGSGTSGNLKVISTGADTLVTASYEEHISTGSVNSAGDFADYADGTDAAAVFQGKVDLAGNISYGDSPGWYVDLVLTGLDPNRKYTFVGTANRGGGAGYADRVTNWKLIGADAATYASSTGTHKVAEDSVEFSTGDNPNGYVARWTDIQPGSDGKIVIRTSHTVGQANGGLPGANSYKGYGGGVFMLRMQPPGNYRWASYNDSAFKAAQVESDFVTTYGLGRSFEGQGAMGPLKNLATGGDVAATVTYTEHISTGSVNSAGDAATYSAGSDADGYFGGIVDLAGNISYGDSPGWYVDLTFSGLDPAKRYTFVGTANRNGGAGYADRVTNWKLLDADTFTYASSTGTKKVGEDSVEFSTGDNPNGYVARWADIAPGTNGTFTIRTSHTVGEANGGLPGANSYKGYAGGVFLLAEQLTSGGGGAKPIEFSSVIPAANQVDVHPNTPILVVLNNGDHAVNPASVKLKVDGADVTPLVTTNDTSTIVNYAFPAMLASSSTHQASLTFTDDSNAATPYTNGWTFQVLDYSGFPALPEAIALPFDAAQYRTRGFALKIAAPDPNDGLFITSIDEAAAIFDQTFTSLVDPGLLNSLGYYIEGDTLNYQIDGNPIGGKSGDRKFPGIAGSGQPGDQFAIQATTLLYLQPGYYHMNITMQDGFRLVAGPPNQETELPETFTPCTNCGGDDAPWFTDFVVTKAGLYPFRILYYNAGGGASLEWVTVTPTGGRLLVNENGLGQVEAYVPLSALPPTTDITIGAQLNAGNAIINWGGSGNLQEAPAVTGPWTTLTGAGSPYTVPASQAARFYRVR